MTDLRVNLRLCLAVAISAIAVTTQANEPIAAPPAPVLSGEPTLAPPVLPPVSVPNAESSGTLAPVALDDSGSSGVVTPAGRRSTGRNSLAPAVIGESTPAYLPGGGMDATQFYSSMPQVLPSTEGAMMPVMEGSPYTTIGDVNLGEATVRISDRPAEQVGDNPPGVRPSNRICPECRYCQHGLPYHQCPHCDPPEEMVRRYRRRHGVVYAPDYGWSPPGKHPIDRISIDYYRAFPSNWNGQPQQGPAIVRPTVYWPTDTTQLGYTYQHSPRWMPYPGMVPPVPHPAQWNIPLYPAGGARVGGPCPHCRGNAAAAYASRGEGQVAERSSTTRPDSQDWAPTDVTQLPTGPALSAPSSSPSLTPVPF